MPSSKPFPGRVGRTVAESAPAWEEYRRPPAGAPNMLVIVLDDVGYAQLGCYGASIATPAIDALAGAGARYTNFHVTSLCSTTRASLLTGRNHHSVGMGFLAGFDSGYPSYRGHVVPEAATVARVLNHAGYGTYALGKWHMVPPAHMTAIGPFDNWPLNRGFDRYYGFLWGEDDQFSPQLWQDNHFIDPPKRAGYHLSDDLVHHAEQMIADHVSAGQDRPFFLYLAFGAAHAPHQAPADYRRKYRGAFDHGWDEERSRVLARQLELGIVPLGTQLCPPNPAVQRWADLATDRKRVYARMQEVFAAFVEHTDTAIGKLLGFLDRHSLTRDTVVVLLSDNGASGEGGEHGSTNEYRYFMGLSDSPDDSLDLIDELGGPTTHNHYPAGWAQAGNTPLKYYKKFTYGGGVRAPLIISWPAAQHPAGGTRDQFHHVVDLAPTLLDIAGVAPASTYDGIAQQPLHGVSMRYSLEDPEAPSQRNAQYFEMGGHRGIYLDGWKAVTNHQPGADYDTETWELYHLADDFAEIHDLASEEGKRLAELTARWSAEAQRYEVYPLDDRSATRALDRGPLGDRKSFVLLPGTRLFTGVGGPNWTNRSFVIRAEISRATSAEGGVLIAYGRRAAGFSLFVCDNRLVLDYNCVGRHTVVQDPSDLPVGRCVIEFDFAVDPDGGGLATLRVDGTGVAQAALTEALRGVGSLSTQVGHNSPSAVSERYEPPFEFSGRLDKVHVEFRSRASDHDVVTELAYD